MFGIYFRFRPRREAFCHEKAERVVLVVAERRTGLIAGGAIKPDCLWLLDACFQTNLCDAPMAGNFFQGVQQSSTQANSPSFGSDKHSLHLGMSGSDHQKCD